MTDAADVCWAGRSQAVISCLCVTHDRPQFMPWVEHQFLKQHIGATGIGEFWPTNTPGAELVIVDSSAVPWESEFATVHHMPQFPGISDKRTIALQYARPFFTWFDDDDWQSPVKCRLAERLWDPPGAIGLNALCAVGARHASMYSTVTGKCGLYESAYEPIIFNSAVYRKSAVPQTFSTSHAVGEDTEWHERWLKTRPTFTTLGEPLHAWLCHGSNITNKANSRFFERPCDIPFDGWELDFLARTFR